METDFSLLQIRDVDFGFYFVRFAREVDSAFSKLNRFAAQSDQFARRDLSQSAI